MRRCLRLLLLLMLGACSGDLIEPEPEPEPNPAPEQGLTIHDPLSMPEEPTLDPEAFASAETCEPCHPTHVAEWKLSAHSYATLDPVWQTLVKVRQDHLNSTEDQFCTQCHSAIGTRGGVFVPGFSFEEISGISMEGVTCEACHKVVGMERNYNSGHVLDATAPMMGGITDPQDTSAHESVGHELIQSAAFCGGCHDVVENSGLNLERGYEEWMQSADAGTETTCQSCHMPAREGPAAEGGPIRTVHNHRWRGVAAVVRGLFITDEAVLAELDEDIDDLLQSSAEVNLDLPQSVLAGAQLDMLVRIANKITGHSLPTGTTFVRQFWLALTVTDSTGKILYQTGHLDDNGDLRNLWSQVDPFGDPDLITLASEFLDEHGQPVLFPWLAVEHVSRAIPALHERAYTLFPLIPEDAVGPLTVNAALKFREFAPFLFEALGAGALIPLFKVRTIAEAQGTVDVE
jgi:hypothetical protein